MAEHQGFWRRLDNRQVSKTTLFWACIGSIVATLIVGFTWGGWTTGATAATMVRQAGSEARAELAAAICVDRFMSSADSTVKLASLKEATSWTRSDVISKGGWVTIAGVKAPVSGAAELCAQRLLQPN